ncbi:MAG: hypothetical protein KHX31_02955 [Akkermansia sp.]|uniref:hypothetical protein n=1 Tax=Akkermansia sp. TaxID=1872421 RepID=UPI0025C6B728|nr:hypothetical protein [Akkermansia sp.]MBS5507572.1 hypothetical protein [Akkermansia sp.]
MSAFSSPALLPPPCSSARKENECPASSPPIGALTQAEDTLFFNQTFKLPENARNCIHSILTSCQIFSFLLSARKPQYAEPHKKAFSFRDVSASQNLLAECLKEGRFEWAHNTLQTALPAGFP